MRRPGRLRAASERVDAQLAGAEKILMSDQVHGPHPWHRDELLALAHIYALTTIATGMAAIIGRLADDEHDDQDDVDVDEPGAEELGRGAYQAYTLAVGGVSFSGESLKPWEQLPQRIRQGWSGAALWARR